MIGRKKKPSQEAQRLERLAQSTKAAEAAITDMGTASSSALANSLKKTQKGRQAAPTLHSPGEDPGSKVADSGQDTPD